MKNQKLLAIVLTGLLLLPTTAFAKGNPHSSNSGTTQTVNEQKAQPSQAQNKAGSNSSNSSKSQNSSKASGSTKGSEQKQENQANREAKKQEIENFKTQMKAKHETMKQIREQVIQLKQQAETKSEQLKSIMTEIDAGTKTLSDDMVTALLSKTDTIKSDSDALKNTAGINKNVSDTQDKVNKKDFNNALSSMDNVIARLQARLDALKKLNADLDDALSIANLAAEPAPSTTTTNDTQSPDAASQN